MLETPHVAVGAAIATQIPDPMIALPLAFASHFVLDRVPHWNPHTYTEVKRKGKISKDTKKFALVDVAIALTIGFYFASRFSLDYQHAIVILFASLASVIPDLAKAPYFLMGQRNGLLKKYVDFERSLQVEVGFYTGMFVQLVVIVVSFVWVSS